MRSFPDVRDVWWLLIPHGDFGQGRTARSDVSASDAPSRISGVRIPLLGAAERGACARNSNASLFWCKISVDSISTLGLPCHVQPTLSSDLTRSRSHSARSSNQCFRLNSVRCPRHRKEVLCGSVARRWPDSSSRRVGLAPASHGYGLTTPRVVGGRTTQNDAGVCQLFILVVGTPCYGHAAINNRQVGGELWER